MATSTHGGQASDILGIGVEAIGRRLRVARDDDAGFGPCGVKNRGGVSLRQHQAIVVLVPRIARVM